MTAPVKLIRVLGALGPALKTTSQMPCLTMVLASEMEYYPALPISIKMEG
jgi:hypothetical protein